MTQLSTLFGRGLHSARPAAGTAGAQYFETDTTTLFRDNGSTWDSIEGTVGGELGYAEITSNISGTGSGLHDATGLSITITAPATAFVVEAFISLMDDNGSSSARMICTIFDVTAAVQVSQAYALCEAGLGSHAYVRVRVNPGAGSRTYKVQVGNSDETPTFPWRAVCSATMPAFIRAAS